MGRRDDLLAPVMIVVALTTALTGILLFCLGFARAGGAIRFVPYPVIGGFLERDRLVDGERRGACHQRPKATRASLDALFGRPPWRNSPPPPAWRSRFTLVLRRVRSPLLLHGMLLAAAALAHLAFALSGLSLADARELGWTFKAPMLIGLAPTWDFNDVRNFPWHHLPRSAPTCSP